MLGFILLPGCGGRLKSNRSEANKKDLFGEFCLKSYFNEDKFIKILMKNSLKLVHHMLYCSPSQVAFLV